jgi:hypothetical protein
LTSSEFWKQDGRLPPSGAGALWCVNSRSHTGLGPGPFAAQAGRCSRSATCPGHRAPSPPEASRRSSDSFSRSWVLRLQHGRRHPRRRLLDHGKGLSGSRRRDRFSGDERGEDVCCPRCGRRRVAKRRRGGNGKSPPNEHSLSWRPWWLAILEETVPGTESPPSESADSPPVVQAHRVNEPSPRVVR